MRNKLRHSLENKVLSSAYEALKDIPSNSTILLGGFGIVGITEHLSNVFSKFPVTGLTIYTNTPGLENYGFGKHLLKGQVKRMCGSYFGAVPRLQKMYFGGEIENQFIPQGTFAERIRCGGIGVAGFYTRTGAETMVDFGGQIIKYKPGTKEAELVMPPKKVSNLLIELSLQRKFFNGKPYILEPAITGDYAFVKVYKADKKGNVQFRYSTNNFNQDMIMAAKVCIVEAEKVSILFQQQIGKIVEVGELKPDEIHTPGIFVDRVVQAQDLEKPIENLMLNRGKLEIQGEKEETKRARKVRERIARRAAKEFKSGMYCNLGIGMPTLIPKYLPSNVKVMLHSENGTLGLGDYPRPGKEDPDIINAGKECTTLIPGASIFSSSVSFGIIRGGHLQMTCLGGLQVSQTGDLANWIIPGKMARGMGGAMDLVASGSQVMVLMEHMANKQSKVMEKCTLPVTGVNCVSKIVTDMGFFKIMNGEMSLVDIGNGYSLEDLKNCTHAKFKVADQLGQFD